MAGPLAAGFIRVRIPSRPGTIHLILASILLLVVLETVSIWSAPRDSVATGFADDAYYYFRIARNIVDRGAVTFDGDTPTNGFHPLWMASVLPAFVASQDRITELRLVATISVLLVGLAAFAGAWEDARGRHSLVAVICTLFLLRYARDFSMMGMETGILLPLSILAMLQARDIAETGPDQARTLRLGITLLLVCLSRLDAAILTVLTVTFLALSRTATARRKEILLLSGGPAVAGLAILVAVNRAAFGRMLSVSGTVKTTFLSFNHLFFEQLSLASPGDPKSLWGVYLLFLAVSVVLIAKAAVPWFTRVIRHDRAAGSADPVELAVCANILLYTAFYLFNSTWRLWQWYVWPAFLVAAFALPGLLERIAPRFGRLLGRLAPRFVLQPFPVVISAGLVVLSVCWGAWNALPDIESFKYRNLVIAQDLNGALHDSDIVAMGDMAGSFSFFFDGRVIQMEGLVGDGRMLDAIESGLLSQYLVSRGTDYILSHEGPRGLYDYGTWELRVPEATESGGPQNTILVSSGDEVMRWESEGGCAFLWRLGDPAADAAAAVGPGPVSSDAEVGIGGKNPSSAPVELGAMAGIQAHLAGEAGGQSLASRPPDRAIEPRPRSFYGERMPPSCGVGAVTQQPVGPVAASEGI